MNVATNNTQAISSAESAAAQSMGQSISAIGDRTILGSIVIVLAWIGSMKFTAYEATAIEGLVASSPFTAWLYNVFSLQGASNLIGLIEVTTAIVLLVGIRYKAAAIAGSLVAVATFAVTLSFVLTAPGWEASLGGFPALSVVPGQFLLKDAVLLGAAISLVGKALTRQS